MFDPRLEGSLRVAVLDVDDAEEGVSGIEENALVKVDVPVVGREEFIGDEGERGVTGESLESRSRRPVLGRGGGTSLPRATFVCI